MKSLGSIFIFILSLAFFPSAHALVINTSVRPVLGQVKSFDEKFVSLQRANGKKHQLPRTSVNSKELQIGQWLLFFEKPIDTVAIVPFKAK